MRVVIAGGRDYILTKADFDWLDALHEQHKFTEVVSGCARGADKGGEGWASSRGIPVKRFRADWRKFGKSAGPKRNARMADYAELVILFPGGDGTSNMLLETRKLGKPFYLREALT